MPLTHRVYRRLRRVGGAGHRPQSQCYGEPMRSCLSFHATAAPVVGYAIAMAYLEAAVVVYLQTALGSQVGVLFPLKPELATGNLIAIEAGREVATLVMIGTVGALAGRTGLERLAWSAAVFGVWDVGYYG